ncbi:S8 family serine peptidase [Pseudarthrobacter sp. NS4]|uniref:S8 family serine peptidase n=1 Tax=Pseudarthrobacter sp. NS4 TaxID=2973976 RepID=UPI002161C947|nr:S8 family serine peptidase [Pseudarthrobacter sp. NS4]
MRGGGLRKAAALAVGLPLLLTSMAMSPATAAPASQEKQAATTSPAAAHFEDGRYIVVLAGAAAAAYEGDIPGLAATKPRKGRKLDAGSPNYKAYDSHLRKQQRDVAAAQGVTPDKQYTAALNGFRAELTAAQAMALSKDNRILVVAPDVENAPDYTTTDFLRLTGSDGIWAKQFGGEANAGKGVVVGVIDSGYAPDNPFLQGEPVQPLQGPAQVGVPYRTAEGRIAMLKADGTTFEGECQKGEGTGAAFDGSLCNSKVIGARYFADSFLQYVAPENRAPEELISPVDVGSHGTHTATTAAGNANVEQVIDGAGFGKSSGVAPAAKVSVYKICWEDTNPATGGCYSSASVEAVEAAIKDGVDVLNYSISGNNNSTTDPVALAFLNAAAAGVFVSASAGNSGPAVSTVNHASPWLTTVAASTFPSDLLGTVKVSDGSQYRGASIMKTEVADKPVMVAEAAAAAGAVNPNLCAPGTLDPAKVAGKVVVCDRGVVDRTAKSQEVQDKGGVGMILVNLTSSSEDADNHVLPTVHVNAPKSLQLKSRLEANPALTVSLVKGDLTGEPPAPAPQIAGFSSRGPTLASGSDLLKPDIAAPGVNVLAGVSTIGNDGDQFGFMSGTSMAAPHIAGFGALVLSKQPAWTPAMVKSAMMTTAYPLVNPDGSANNDPFQGGAGHIDSTRVLDPGLVYNSGIKDWLGFLNGQGVDTGAPQAGTIAARDLNLPSIALGSLVGEVQVKRQLTALVPGMYRPEVNMPDFNVQVEPKALNFARAGQTREVTLTIRNGSAPVGKFSTGTLAWKGPRTVSSPIAIRPVDAQIAPSFSFSSATGNGSATMELVSGSDSPIAVGVEGLAPLGQTAITKTPGEYAPTNDAHNALLQIDVPAGASFARLGVQAQSDDVDWDIVVYAPNVLGGFTATQVATASASEFLDLESPRAGTYYIVANLYSTPDSGAATASVQAVSFAGDAGNLTVEPNPIAAPNGTATSATLSWSGLSQGSYLSRLSLGGNGIRTWVSVQIGPAASAAPAGAPALALAQAVPAA